jgi:hypothetical protein
MHLDHSRLFRCFPVKFACPFRFGTILCPAVRICSSSIFLLFISHRFCPVSDEIDASDPGFLHWDRLRGMQIFKVVCRIGTEETTGIVQAAEGLCGREETG